MWRLLLCILIFMPSASWALQHYEARVVGKKPQSREHFVQGLEIHGQYIYLSTGNYGQSHLLRYRFDDLSLQSSTKLNAKLFAEGLTVLGERVFQLTWRNKMALVYSKDTLQLQSWFPLAGEGWGLTNNGKELIYSDGSHYLHFLSPATGQLLRSIAVRQGDKAVTRLNELEWIDGMVWANIWQTNRIVIIEPDTGTVTASIDLTGLLPASEYRPGTNVLNGIAQNPADGGIWVTGKRWPWMYQIELLPRTTTRDSAPPAPKSR